MGPSISLDKIPGELLQAKQAAITQFLRTTEPPPAFTVFAVSTDPRHNVVGVGIGLKITKGVVTQRHAIRFYVVNKIAVEAISNELLLPTKIEGVETDVIETGRFRAFRSTVPTVRRRLRPLQPGC